MFGVWNPPQGLAYTGDTVSVVVIDDGFDFAHPDLAPNYLAGLDYDFIENDLDPSGAPTDSRGTAVLGLIGADNNGTGTVGVAFDADLIGYRVAQAGVAFQTDVAEALTAAANNVFADVVNIGLNYADERWQDTSTDIEAALANAVAVGRFGLGSTVVVSAGNTRGGFDTNADDWKADTRQIVVAAVDQNGFILSYSTPGASILVSAFGTPGQVVTTDRVGAAGFDTDDFTETFGGTQAATAMVTGVTALIYDANPNLGWRDVQSILANAARHVGSAVGGPTAGFELNPWYFNAASTWNGGGLHFSNDYGYGLVDALAAVRLAETWLLTGTAAQRDSNQFTNTMDMVNAPTIIPDGNLTGTTFTGIASFDDIVDRVTVSMNFSTMFTGDLEIYLTSPHGVEHRLMGDTGGILDHNGLWVFESQAFRGERAAGTWSVRVVDDARTDVLTVSDLVVTTFGIFSSDDRYIFTNEYSDYAGLFGHLTAVTDTNGGTDTVNAAAVTTGSTIRLDGAGSGIDGVVVTFTGIENAIGGDGGDTIIGSNLANLLIGMRGDDTLRGGNGDDVLRGETGNDVLDGEAGNDTASYVGATAGVQVNLSITGAQNTGVAGTDTLTAIERLIGSAFADFLTGDANANFLSGESGADRLNGGGGDDTLDGGSELDTADYSDAPAGVAVNLGAVGPQNTGGAGIDTLVSIENGLGSAFGDQFFGSGGGNTIFGQGGGDTINGLGGADLVFAGAGGDFVLGGTGDDTLIGNDNPFLLDPDTLFGEDNNDTIYAERSDLINGGNGTDNLYAVNAFDFTLDMGATLFEFAQLDFGNDFVTAAGQTVGVQIFSGGGNDSVIGSAFTDFIYTSAGNDTVDGGGGSDTLIGDVGIDSLSGGEGNDFIYFDAEDSFVSGGNGFDAGYITAGGGVIVNMGAAGLEFVQDFAGGNDSILGSTMATGLQAYTGGGNDFVDGSPFADVVFALGGTDILIGNGGNDVLVGGLGQDILSGGLGNDALYGNGGSGGDGVTDVFRFQHSGAANADAVYDFQATSDKIDLTAFGSSIANVTIANAGGDAVVYLNGQLICTVVGVGVSLTNADFIM